MEEEGGLSNAPSLFDHGSQGMSFSLPFFPGGFGGGGFGGGGVSTNIGGGGGFDPWQNAQPANMAQIRDLQVFLKRIFESARIIVVVCT